jgi:hypothetical protein
MPPSSPYRMALVQNVTDAYDPGFKEVNFVTALESVLRLLGVLPRTEFHIRGLNVIDMQMVDSRLLVKYGEWVASVMADGGKTGTYFSQVGKHQVGDRPVWYCTSVPHKVAVGFLRFRLGGHYLRINTGRWQKLARAQRRCVRCAAMFERRRDVPVDDETHCLINCQEPVLALHRGHLEHQLRRYHPHPATNSMQELFAAVQETGRKCLMRQLMGFVARCERVARCCHNNLQAWQAGTEVQKAVAVTGYAEWMAQQEMLYAMGMIPGLSSDTTIDESSELSEVSVQGPAELLADSESVGDSEEWEDVL